MTLDHNLGLDDAMVHVAAQATLVSLALVMAQPLDTIMVIGCDPDPGASERQ